MIASSKMKNLLAAMAMLSCIATVRAAEQPGLSIDSVVLRPLQVAEVPAQQTGLLKQIVVEEGQQVVAGQLLAALDERQAALTVARAEYEFAQSEAKAKNEISILYAEKALEVAKAELKRSSESIEQFPKSISQSQLDVEQLTVEKLTLERRQAEHELVLERYGVQLKESELKTARLQLDQHQLTAPFAGKVALIRGRLGEWVEVGSPVVRLVAVDKLRAEGFLAADQASADLIGKSVGLTVVQAGETKRLSGVLRFVSPEMEPVTRQVRVWAEIANPDGVLRPGQQGTLHIEL